MLRFILPLALAGAGLWAQEIRVTQVAPAAAAAEWVSIEGAPVKPVTGAPYTARAVTTSTQTLADGNRITNTTEVSLARDSQGRTRREQKLNALGPWTTNESGSLVTINDPVAGVTYTVHPDGKTATKFSHTQAHVAHGVPSGGVALRSHAPAPVVATGGPATGNTMVFVHAEGSSAAQGVAATFTHASANSRTAEEARAEDLGTQTIEGVTAKGKRTRIVIPAGQIGNERPIEVISESWYSPELQTVVLSKRTDPRTGETEFRLTNISRVEPSPSLFQPPANVNVVPGVRHEQ